MMTDRYDIEARAMFAALPDMRDEYDTVAELARVLRARALEHARIDEAVREAYGR